MLKSKTRLNNKILKNCISLFSIVSLFLVTSCIKKNGSNETERPITLVMAEVNPPDSITGKFDKAFKEKVEELSNKTIKIDLQYSGILGDESQIMKLIISPDSSIQLARVSASLASYGGKKSKLITIPYTFSNTEHFWKFAESELAKEILDEPYVNNLGVKGICYGEEGFRHFFSINQIKSIEDMKDMKVRVSSSKTMQDLVKSLEANPVTVNFTDLFAKMQIGEVNAAEQPIANYYSNGFHKVAPYMIMDGHNLGAVQILINAVTWNTLSSSQQAVLKEAGRYASEVCKKISIEAENKIIEKLTEEGASIIQVKDKTPWQEACKNTIDEASKDYPELYKKILELNK